MKKIKITLTRRYTRTAVVEIPFPDDIHNLDEVRDFLHDNEDLYMEKMDNALREAPLEGEFEFDHTRYDVEESVVLKRNLWGGTL